MLTDEQVAEAAAALFRAELDGEPIEPISQTYPDADVPDAYRISTAIGVPSSTVRPHGSRRAGRARRTRTERSSWRGAPDGVLYGARSSDVARKRG